MTREEAIFCEKSYIGETNCKDCKYYSTNTCKSRESHKMAIKALEQQPCEDCISREDAIKQCGFGMTSLHIADNLRRLPSVQPKPKTETITEFADRCRECGKQKTGHWIKPKGKVKPFGDDTVQCDMCGFFTDVDCYYNFCPNCGCMMIEEGEHDS